MDIFFENILFLYINGVFREYSWYFIVCDFEYEDGDSN